MPTVYLLQLPTTEKDLSSAAKYGKIVPIFDSGDKPLLNATKSFDILYNALESFDQDKDYLCAAGGDPLLEFFAGVVMVNLHITSVMHLVWNRVRDGDGIRNGTGYYIPKKIILKGFIDA